MEMKAQKAKMKENEGPKSKNERNLGRDLTGTFGSGTLGFRVL